MTDDTTTTSPTPPLLVERDGHVETWTLNRPEVRNAISDAGRRPTTASTARGRADARACAGR